MDLRRAILIFALLLVACQPMTVIVKETVPVEATVKPTETPRPAQLPPTMYTTIGTLVPFTNGVHICYVLEGTTEFDCVE